MKSWLRSILAVAAVLATLTAAPVQAGWKQNYPVRIVGNVASGSIGSARNSGDSTQWIECTLDANPMASWGQCFAKTASGAWLICGTSNPNLLAAIANLKSYGHVEFTVDSGNCTRITTRVSSYLAPPR
jgi:hypothetical protein